MKEASYSLSNHRNSRYRLFFLNLCSCSIACPWPNAHVWKHVLIHRTLQTLTIFVFSNYYSGHWPNFLVSVKLEVIRYYSITFRIFNPVPFRCRQKSFLLAWYLFIATIPVLRSRLDRSVELHANGRMIMHYHILYFKWVLYVNADCSYTTV